MIGEKTRVITNDEMDAEAIEIGTDVTLTPGVLSHPNLQMNPDGIDNDSLNINSDGTYNA